MTTDRKKAQKGALPPRKQKFVLALFQYPTVKAAAAACGIAERTAHYWLDEPEVIAALRKAEGDALEETTRGLLRLSGDAVTTLGDAMTDQDAATGAKIRAADIVLSRLLQLRELVTLEERIAALEAKQ